MTLQCPSCGSTELEKRASRRVYAPLDENGEIDGWSEGDDFDWDVDDNGNDIIYCVNCDNEYTAEELVTQEGVKNGSS